MSGLGCDLCRASLQPLLLPGGLGHLAVCVPPGSARGTGMNIPGGCKMGRTLALKGAAGALSTDCLPVNYTSGLKLPFQGESNNKPKGKKGALNPPLSNPRCQPGGSQQPCLPQQVPSQKSCFTLLAVLGTLRHADISSFAFFISKGTDGQLRVTETKGNQ